MGANTFVIPVNEVVVPEGRFRAAKPARVEKIASSFLRFGQLQPIIVEPQTQNDQTQYELIDGLHRLSAVEINGGTEIVALLRGDMSELLKREAELEVNIQREDMTWQERTAAITELDRIKSAQDPTWTQSKTGELAGVERTRVAEAKKIEDMAALFPEIHEAKNLSQALNMAKRKAEQILRVKEVQDAPDDFRGIDERLHLGDAVEIIKTFPDETFHAIVTDPPFGVDYDKRTSSTATVSAYKDSTEYYEYLLTIAPDMYRVIKPDGWLIWFLGISWYERVKAVFRECGFVVDEIPLVWDRSSGRTFSTNAKRWFCRGYDIALHCCKGDPQLVAKNKDNVLKFAPMEGSEKELLVERPLELYRELIQRLTYPGEHILDLFAGSGACPAAAAQIKREWTAVEKDPERRAVALKKIRAYTND